MLDWFNMISSCVAEYSLETMKDHLPHADACRFLGLCCDVTKHDLSDIYIYI